MSDPYKPPDSEPENNSPRNKLPRWASTLISLSCFINAGIALATGIEPESGAHRTLIVVFIVMGMLFAYRAFLPDIPPA